MNSSKPVWEDEDSTKKYKNYVKSVLDDDYVFLCLKKCITDYSTPLENGEKVCMAKCLDRASDNLSKNEKILNPYNPKNKDIFTKGVGDLILN
jgi:hypothetical protein